jgi:hypothetical protein
MKITRGKTVVPRRVMLYGTHGIGKSSWAAQAPDVLFLNLEDGLNDIDTAKTQHLRTYADVKGALSWLFANPDHGFKWVAIDTLDWLESLIHADVAERASKKHISEIPYGAGYKSAMALWDSLLDGLDIMRRTQGVGVILLAHTAIRKHQDPTADSYDRYQPALHETASALVQEWCDEVLFASYRVYTRKEDQGFNKERTIASGASERYLRCVETPAALAKNRLNMPGEIEFSWAAYAQHITGVSSEVKG